jgi:hypothetical protein
MSRFIITCVSIAALIVGGCCNCPSESEDMAATLSASRARMLAAAPDPEPTSVIGDTAEQQRSITPVVPGSPDNLLYFTLQEEATGDEFSTKAEPDAHAGQRSYAHWRNRKGPAYPGDFWHSFGRDAKEFLPIVWDDTKTIATSEAAWIAFAAAGAAGIALSGPNGNDDVEEHFTKNGSQLNTFWDTVGDVGGNPGVHFAVAGAMYLGGLYQGDDETYAKGKMMLSALSINGLLTLGLKAAARTESPNGDEYGWPSGHTSSSFCFAAAAYETYGPWVGLPLYGFAAFVGYERIDARNHDFNDVISGALIGAVIGHIVARNHENRLGEWEVLPFAGPDGTMGLNFMRRW